MGLVEWNRDCLCGFSRLINEQKQLNMNDAVHTSGHSPKQTIVESFCGTQLSSTIDVHSPLLSKNKDSGSCLKGGKEKAVEESRKNKRVCEYCKKGC